MSTGEGRLREREDEEVRRSACEAEIRAGDDLRYTEQNLQRYLDPPATTAFALEYAYHLLGDVHGKRVLDLGCGTGDNTVLLARRGADVHSLDISNSLIELARKRLIVNGIQRGVTFHVGSAHALPFLDGSFDVVFGMAILHHLDLDLTSREVWRVLRQGGCAIFKEPVRNSRLLTFLRKFIPWRHPDVSAFERPLRDEELRRFARNFADCQERVFVLPYVSVAEVLRMPPGWIGAIHRFDHWVLQKAPWLSFYATSKVIKVVK